MKFVLILFCIFGIMYLSGCIYTSNYYDNNNYSKIDERVEQVINQHEQQLSCNDNNICTKDIFNKENNLCTHTIIIPCCGNTFCEQDSSENYFNCKQDCSFLKDNYIAKVNSCNRNLKMNSLTNNCNQNNITEKEQCIFDLVQKTQDSDCCFNISSFEDSNNIESKKQLNKCLIDYSIKNKNPNNCFDTSNKKECFICYLKNTHQNVFSNDICKNYDKEKNLFCKSSLLKNYEYCNNITDIVLKQECKNTDIVMNNCIYYQFDIPAENKNKTITNKKEFQNNTKTILIYSKRILIDENIYLKQNKQINSYKFNFDNNTLSNKILDNCTINKNKISIDYNNEKYSTFYFDYKEYQFVYSILVFDDFYNYTKKMKDQYCYEFDEKEPYKRYLKDELNNAILEKIAQDFNALHNKGFSDNEIFEIIVRFVQQIPYNYNWEHKNVYPYEVIWSMSGVCLDKSIILAKILADLGYETYLVAGTVDYTKSSFTHALIAVPCDNSTITYNNKKICFIETTFPYLINEMPIANKLDYYKISDGKKYTEANYGPENAKKLKEYLSKMDLLQKQIQEFLDKKDWQEYNKLVLEYNDYLYKYMQIKFDTFQ